MRFADTLHDWYDENRRDLPWRGENDPYKIWVSEIILQQTRVQQGWSYYIRFIETFPDIRTLAEASVEQILKIWQGLGYYSRARNMHHAARTIMEYHQGIFPKDHNQIINLKGIGEYTAAAIASIAFQSPYPAVDGNVFRVICRIFGISEDIRHTSVKKMITEKCHKLMKEVRSPGIFNEAMMEFGALQCIPKNPDCHICPFQNDCYAYQHDMITQLPFKSNPVKIKSRYFHYFFFLDGEKTIIRQRTKRDIWQGLFELPLIESDSSNNIEVENILRQYDHPSEPYFVINHQLTHQKIRAFFYVIKTKKITHITEENDTIISIHQIVNHPFPRMIDRFFRTFPLLAPFYNSND